MRGRTRLLVLTSPLLFLVGGCGSSISKDDFRATLTKKPSPGLSEAVATCVTDELFRNLTETEREHVYAGELPKLTKEERQAVSDAVVLCASGGPATKSTTTSGAK